MKRSAGTNVSQDEACKAVMDGIMVGGKNRWELSEDRIIDDPRISKEVSEEDLGELHMRSVELLDDDSIEGDSPTDDMNGKRNNFFSPEMSNRCSNCNHEGLNCECCAN